MREVFADYDPHFLPMSLDEAYLDITEHLEQRQHWPESRRTHQFCEVKTTGGTITVKYQHINISKDFRHVQIAYTVSSCLLKLNENFFPDIPMKEVNNVETSVGAETDTLSPLLFDDSPRSSPIAPVAVGKVEVFGTSPEEAVREMRFRIEQTTTLTASAGNT